MASALYLATLCHVEPGYIIRHTAYLPTTLTASGRMRSRGLTGSHALWPTYGTPMDDAAAAGRQYKRRAWITVDMLSVMELVYFDGSRCCWVSGWAS